MTGQRQILYANVIVDISHEKLDKIFQYRVPEELQAEIRPGTAVTIPFGNGNRRIQGYVIGLTEHSDYPPEKIKEIQEVSQGQMKVEGKLIALAAWMRDYYGSTMIQALKAVLPVKQKVTQREQKQIRLLLKKEEAQEMLALFEKKNQKARARLLGALLEAAEQGLDTCIICAFREDAVKDLLHVPASARVVSMVALGYGADNSPRKTKKNMEEIVSYDRF